VDINKFAGSEIAILLAFILGLAVVSWLIPRLLRLNGPDTAAINIEVTFRNINLALLIKASLFPAVVGVADPVGDMVLFTLLLYGGLAFPVAAGQVFLHGRNNREASAAG
jgi:BASS family bile acid:Na+ symporter